MIGKLKGKQLLATGASLVFLAVCNPAGAQAPGIWQAGGFTFSDELGGFRILAVQGTGSRLDPITIEQEIYSSISATLTIRSLVMENSPGSFGHVSMGALHLRLVTRNRTNLPWIGFGLELQEVLDQPSVYGDGLSFDQLGRNEEDIYSDRFRSFSGEFEPADRLVYTNGWVDAFEKVSVTFLITDYTPVGRFYIYQDPMIPAS